MCGIAGIVDYSKKKSELSVNIKKMTDLINYRGPDAEGFYVKDGIALGHRRLSIIDLSTGDQPMSNLKQTVWIIFNGEIYNFPEIRKQFEEEGYPFRTHSDTEVLIALYEKYGVDMLDKINGMFAFALWDEKKKQIFIARDRMGKKPLFYYWDNKCLIFGSEMKSVLAGADIPRVVNPQSVDMFFSFGVIPAPYTALHNIHKLLPGNYLVFSADKRKIAKYWDIQFNPIDVNTPREALEDELYDLIYNAVKRRLISDVPLGAFLSGGVDSSAVVGMMSIINKIAVKSFTIDFEEGDYSEAGDARIVAEHFKTIHKELTVRPSSFEILDDIVWHFDEPFGDSSAIPSYYVSKMAREYVTVVLSGDGGDELFAGYNRYLRMNQLDLYKNIPPVLKKWVLAPLAKTLPLNFPAKNRLLAITAKESDFGLGIYPFIKPLVFSEDLYSNIDKQPLTFETFPQLGEMNHLHPLSKKQYLDIKMYLPDDILVKVDKMSMANSLETRAPLLDYTIAEFAAKIPPQWHIENGEGKAFLKKTVKRFLPEHVFNKAKHGFSIPKETWFKKDLRKFASDILLSEQAKNRGFFNSAQIEKVLKIHAEGVRDYSKWIWCLLNFELWQRSFVDSGTRKV